MSQKVMKYKEVWDDLTRRWMGSNLDHPYIILKMIIIESVWNLLSKLYSRNLLYKGYTIQPYSPAAWDRTVHMNWISLEPTELWKTLQWLQFKIKKDDALLSSFQLLHYSRFSWHGPPLRGHYLPTVLSRLEENSICTYWNVQSIYSPSGSIVTYRGTYFRNIFPTSKMKLRLKIINPAINSFPGEKKDHGAVINY